MTIEYSSFLLSGLLSPPSSTPPSLRRGSLPPESTSDQKSLFYFTLEPDYDQYRSFLSLDLAESHRSLHRRPSSSREPPFAKDFQIPDSPCLLPPRSPLNTRNSPTHSQRGLPSPHPVPRASLPIVPSPNTPFLIQPAPPKRKPSVASHATRASATTSTVSTRYRRVRRNKALDCLEGRRPPPRPVSTGNFMSLSDDEDEDDAVSADESELAPAPPTAVDPSLLDDQLIMLIARLDESDLRSAPPTSLSFSHTPSEPRSKTSSRGSSGRRKKPALALKSFMDFHNDDREDSGHWSWRSFIEVAT